MDATDSIRIGYISFKKFVNHIEVTLHAVALENSPVLLLDHDRFVKILKGESLGMVVSIFGLGNVLAHEGMRKMAIHTGRNGMVTRLQPGLVLRGHDVTVDACLGICTEVR